MQKTCVVLLLTLAGIGCGYSSSGNGAMAAGAPAISQLAPNSAASGGTGFTLTVNGTNFSSGAAVYWNASPRTTNFVSASKLTAAISAADITTVGTALVYVKNPGGTGIYMNQGGQSSTTVNFTVTP